MTSNLGSEIIQNDSNYNDIKNKIDHLLFKYFKPEFLNRIDEIITFKPLARESIKEIAKLEMEKISTMLIPNKITMTIDNSAIEQLSKLGFNPVLGARPLRRVIQKEIQD